MRRVRRQDRGSALWPAETVVDPGLLSRLKLFSVLAAGIGALALVGLGSSAASAAPVTKGIPGWGYELVTPPSTGGQESSVYASSPSGDQVVMDSAGGFADVDSLSNLGATYRGRRTPTGWQTATLGNPPSDVLLAAYSGNMDVERGWWLKDAPRTVFSGYPTVPTRPDVLDTYAVFAGSKGGPWLAVAPETRAMVVRATTRDLSSFLISVREKFTLTDGSEETRNLTGTGETLLISRRNLDGTLDLRQVARDGAGSMLPTCTIILGDRGGSAVVRGAVNRDDFSRVIFTVQGTGCTTAARTRVWAADPFSDSPSAVEISATKCDDGNCGAVAAVRFVGGALDVSRVYMTTTQKLVNSDAHAGTDIYEYDFRKPSGQRLSLVTGNSTAANVQGVLEVSDDGSRVFFVATGDLDDAVHGDVGPVEGSRNLYLRMDDPDGGPPITRFIATLSASDSVATTNSRRGSITADGRYFTFVSTARLTSDDEDDFADVYRYDVETGEMLRIWTDDPAHNGINRVAGADTSGLGKGGQYANYEYRRDGRGGISDDASAITLSTAEPLVPGDLNGTRDAFVWRAETGDIAMVSDGKDLRGVTPNAISSDGSTIFFTSVSQIVPEHTSSSQAIYAYRRGGGFAAAPAPAGPCRGDECQGQGTAPGDQRLGSVEFAGAGNVASGADRVRASVSVSKAKPVVGTAGRLRVRVPAAGRITVGGASVRGASTSASKAGSYSVRVALSAKARKALAKRKSLSVRVRVSYRARSGKRASKTVVVTFKRLSAKPGSVKKGGK